MKKKIFKIAVIIIAAFIGVAGSDAVRAQGILDGDSAEMRQQVSVKLPEIEFGQQNEYFSTALTLQKQIALIKKLTERENRINDIIKSYRDMGAEFTPPLPERDLCEQIPPNKICHSYFRGMYKNYNPDITFNEKIAVQVPSASSITDSVIPPTLDIPKQLSEQTPEEKRNLKKALFSWTQITCFEGRCRAVIAPVSDVTDEDGNPIGTFDTKQCYTVREGDTLPSGAVITKIAASGIETRNNGKTGVIEPAPAEKTSAKE